MKKLIILAAILALMTGCISMGGKNKTVVKQDSAATQQARAAAAQAELEDAVTTGNMSLEPPKQAAPAAKPAAPEKPAAVMPPKTKPMTLGSLKPETKYPLQDGYPVWFFTPVYDGYIGAVGIAPKQSRGGISAQKRVARMQAQKNLAKQISVLVNSEVNVESLGVDSSTVQYYRQKVTSLTKEQVDQYLTGFRVMDEWTDEKTGEYYMWMVLEK